MQTFFPNLVFGWTFYSVLILILSIAAVVDFRHMVVPKWLTLPTLGLGVVFNVVRGGWLGVLEREAWHLGANGWLVGTLDGFLFALAGFALGFGLFFIMWGAGVFREAI